MQPTKGRVLADESKYLYVTCPRTSYCNELASVIKCLRIYLQFFPWPPHSHGFLWFDLIKSNTFTRHGYIFEKVFLNYPAI